MALVTMKIALPTSNHGESTKVSLLRAEREEDIVLILVTETGDGSA
eukprot:CAMPEP_0172894818 /NCGR_PEP_ID=MMETSP1075-20121228/151720_1 /TAXON_ID=2916 /ORGANISM="Ceratium fusus, Strain PA161109" /LENGTH=45 /DNA_ID= /DNA_START= /DNA_END= /DNA_ORIENTATION=